jgi:ferric-dicitrate binding protein FerR (iron transport regulator)
MDIERYKTFSAEDFILDQNFVGLVTGKFDPQNSIEHIKEKFPQKSSEIDLAVNVVKALQSSEEEQSEAQILELWKQIVRKRGRQIRLQIFKYAAAVFFIIGIGSASMYILKSQSNIEKFASSRKISGNEAALILADGKKIEISGNKSVIQYTGDGTSVSVNDTTRVEQVNIANSFNQMIVPFGKRSSMELSDGTKVWLNSGSKLVYATAFTGKTREVFLEGEAYFEVAKDAAKPFYVKTDAFRIMVLGTKFDVKAYKDDNEYNTILVEGKVSMKVNNQLFSKEVLLLPHEKSTLMKEQDNFQITHVDDVNICTSWIYGYLEFEKENLADVLKSISRFYNIAIEVKTGNQLKKVSGKLDLKTEPERILNGLARLSNTQFIKKDGKYVFYE